MLSPPSVSIHRAVDEESGSAEIVHATDPIDVLGLETTGSPASAEGYHQAMAIRIEEESNEQRLVVVTAEALLTSLGEYDAGVSAPTEGFEIDGQNRFFARNVMHFLDETRLPPLVCYGIQQGVSQSMDVPNPAFAARSGPKILVDNGHAKIATLGDPYNRMAGFKSLLSKDGYTVEASSSVGDAATLSALPPQSIVLIGNADDPIDPPEATALLDWVNGGGALWLIVDHLAISSYASISSTLGIEFAGSLTTFPSTCMPFYENLCFARDYRVRVEDPPIYDWEGVLDDAYPIVVGRAGLNESVPQVRIFFGRSVRAIANPALAVAEKVAGAPDLGMGGGVSSAGNSVGMAIPYGQGRIYVSTEAAGHTAQRRPFGFNEFGEEDNQQYTLNIAHWLSDLL